MSLDQICETHGQIILATQRTQTVIKQNTFETVRKSFATLACIGDIHVWHKSCNTTMQRLLLHKGNQALVDTVSVAMEPFLDAKGDVFSLVDECEEITEEHTNPGVYAIILWLQNTGGLPNGQQKMLYIGMTGNLSKRTQSHWRNLEKAKSQEWAPKPVSGVARNKAYTFVHDNRKRGISCKFVCLSTFPGLVYEKLDTLFKITLRIFLQVIESTFMLVLKTVDSIESATSSHLYLPGNGYFSVAESPFTRSWIGGLKNRTEGATTRDKAQCSLCPDDGKRIRQFDMEEHVLTKHSSFRFSCMVENCKRTYPSRRGLQRHMKTGKHHFASSAQWLL